MNKKYSIPLSHWDTSKDGDPNLRIALNCHVPSSTGLGLGSPLCNQPDLSHLINAKICKNDLVVHLRLLCVACWRCSSVLHQLLVLPSSFQHLPILLCITEDQNRESQQHTAHTWPYVSWNSGAPGMDSLYNARAKNCAKKTSPPIWVRNNGKNHHS